MFKKSIRFSLLYFIVSNVWQLIVKDKVMWIDNIIVCLIIFLIILIYEWSKVPYKWNKGKQ